MFAHQFVSGTYTSTLRYDHGTAECCRFYNYCGLSIQRGFLIVASVLRA